jgi:hypothetical protein
VTEKLIGVDAYELGAATYFKMAIECITSMSHTVSMSLSIKLSNLTIQQFTRENVILVISALHGATERLRMSGMLPPHLPIILCKIFQSSTCNGACSTCPFFEPLAAPSAKPRPPFSIPQTPISPAHRRSSNFGTIGSVIVVLVRCNVSCVVVPYRKNMGINLSPPAFLLNLTELKNVKPLSAHLASMANSSAILRGPKPFTRFQIKK